MIQTLQTVQTKTLNISPKVAAPAFVGFVAAAGVCVAKHYNLSIDYGTATSVIVAVMTVIGWLVPPAHVIGEGGQNGKET